MATPITVSITHQLGRAEARRRIEAGLASMIRQFPGGGKCNERWDGDQLTFGVAGMGQTFSVVAELLKKKVTIKIELTGVLGLVASSLKRRLESAGRLLLTKE